MLLLRGYRGGSDRMTGKIGNYGAVALFFGSILATLGVSLERLVVAKEPE